MNKMFQKELTKQKKKKKLSQKHWLNIENPGNLVATAPLADIHVLMKLRKRW